jgi:thiaminase (transcriptional activator TenA)
MGNDSFTQQLRQEYDSLFEAIYEHPFVVGIRKGELSRDQLIHYVRQDYLYLDAYIRLYGVAISKCRTREEMAYFHNGIAFILNDEVQPHHNFCRVAGVTLEQIQTDRLAPTARHYINHMLTTAQSGTLTDLYAAMLPCPWTYEYIAKRMIQEEPPGENHPFREWIAFYGETPSPSYTDILCAKLDEAAASLRQDDLDRLREAFAVSCRMEYEFWDMAFTLEED